MGKNKKWKKKKKCFCTLSQSTAFCWETLHLLIKDLHSLTKVLCSLRNRTSKQFSSHLVLLPSQKFCEWMLKFPGGKVYFCKKCKTFENNFCSISFLPSPWNLRESIEKGLKNSLTTDNMNRLKCLYIGRCIISCTGLKSGSFRFLRNHKTPGLRTWEIQGQRLHPSNIWKIFCMIKLISKCPPLWVEEWKRQNRRHRPSPPASEGTWWSLGLIQNSALCLSKKHQTFPTKQKDKQMLTSSIWQILHLKFLN